MKQLFVLIVLFMVLGSGCASLPGHELSNARQALANAQAVEAETFAATEYLAAKAALLHAEELVTQGEYQAARELLPYATAQARQAAEQAVNAKHELAKRQAEKLDAERKQLEAEQPRQKPAPPSVKPPPPAKVPEQLLSSYQVTNEESLWQIAAKANVYADGTLWPLLYKANRDQIKDPRKVYPGQILEIPRPTQPAELQAARKEAADSGIFPTSP